MGKFRGKCQGKSCFRASHHRLVLGSVEAHERRPSSASSQWQSPVSRASARTSAMV